MHKRSVGKSQGTVFGNFVTILLDAAVTAFTSKPSSPFHAVETHDLTLLWNYTLDGTVSFAKLINVTGGGNVEIARKIDGRSTTVQPSFLERFRADISDTQAWLKILRVQRSDQGHYEFDLSASISGSLTHVVGVIVQRK